MESYQAIEDRHARELQELYSQCKLALKGAKKTTKAQIEAQFIQMEFDLKAKHREEMDEFEERQGGERDGLAVQISQVSIVEEKQKTEEEIAAEKKAKHKKKQEKKNNKEKQREEAKNQILANQTEPSAREIEMNRLLSQLSAVGLMIKDIPSDGNCLYRAIADQLLFTNKHGGDNLDFKELRVIAAEHIRENAAEFAPFLGLSSDEIPDYCDRIASPTLAEWGGQVEITALSQKLRRQIQVFAANAPLLKMGDENGKEPLRISFHKHYYTLGEHYNSVIPIEKDCGCDEH